MGANAFWAGALGQWLCRSRKQQRVRSSAALKSVDTIIARVYKGIPLFGQTEILKRIPPRSLTGWC